MYFIKKVDCSFQLKQILLTEIRLLLQITSKGLDRNCPQLVPNERCEFEQKFDTCQTNTDCKYGNYYFNIILFLFILDIFLFLYFPTNAPVHLISHNPVLKHMSIAYLLTNTFWFRKIWKIIFDQLYLHALTWFFCCRKSMLSSQMWIEMHKIRRKDLFFCMWNSFE